MEPRIQEKQAALRWCLEHLHFQRREIYWILNYLLTHPAILKNVHFVEQAGITQRGLVIHAETTTAPMYLTVTGQEFTDAEQIFHEIRFHWDTPLYLEIIFAKTWQTAPYVGVLEDNPEHSWNGTVDENLKSLVDDRLTALEAAYTKEQLWEEIDEALENGDQEKFQQLSTQLKSLTKKSLD